MTKGDNQSVQVFDVRGTCQPDSLKKSLIEMSLTAELSGRTKRGLYHVVINPRPREDRLMTKAQWHRAAEIIERKRGLTGHKRVMVLHRKKNRYHMHVAWERYNHDTGLMNCNKHSNYDLKHCRRTMEIEFGHKLTAEKNNERALLKELLPNLFAQHPTGRGFQQAVEKAGYTLAIQKHRRPYVIINRKGRSFELVKEIPKVRTRQVREKLKGLNLPDKNEIIDAIRERENSRRHNKTREQIASDLKQTLTRDAGKSKSRGR
ncbi:relaxase/mobilization nuclease domain-containing protein [Niastella populi]|uniref:relaxase/mobilization nuclease domain-containing protein n=1 Tax=Niastella populi TaxID=550983 RepID=UPI001F604C7E|nr:relaxase/mobilization nuclease domain-containing protein [Niastella populi]